MRRTAMGVAAFAMLACTSTTEPAPAVHAVERLTPNGLTSVVGTEVRPAPRVRVVDDRGNPIAGVRVMFTASDGAVHVANRTTDGAGVAAVREWRLGTTAGPQTLAVRAGGAMVVFTATAVPGPLTQLLAWQGDGQTGLAGTALRSRLRVRTLDGFGNPIAGIEVTFAVVEGGGTIASPTAITDSDGIAVSGDWTLGPASGSHRVVARSAGFAAEFTAFACPEPCPELVFVREGNIHRFNVATGESQQLTHGGRDGDPAWSPDGSRIAFARRGSGSTPTVDLHVMNGNGSNVVRRTAGTPFHSPSWSPDGASIVVDGDWWACIYECTIYVLAADSDQPPRPIASMGADPAWSPDGTRIAYVSLSGDDGYHALHITSPDGRETSVPVPRQGGGIFNPSWSPDGTRIVFAQCDGGTCGIYTVAPDGTSLTQVATGEYGPDPVWSPDGRHLAFTLWPHQTIVYVPATGGAPVPLIQGGHSPAWRP